MQQHYASFLSKCYRTDQIERETVGAPDMAETLSKIRHRFSTWFEWSTRKFKNLPFSTWKSYFFERVFPILVGSTVIAVLVDKSVQSMDSAAEINAATDRHRDAIAHDKAMHALAQCEEVANDALEMVGRIVERCFRGKLDPAAAIEAQILLAFIPICSGPVCEDESCGLGLAATASITRGLRDMLKRCQKTTGSTALPTPIAAARTIRTIERVFKSKIAYASSDRPYRDSKSVTVPDECSVLTTDVHITTRNAAGSIEPIEKHGGQYIITVQAPPRGILAPRNWAGAFVEVRAICPLSGQK